MTIAHDTCFLLYFVVPAYDWLPATFLREFLLSVLFWLSVIALVGRMLCELFFYALNLDLVFVIWQRLWWLVGVWSCGSWISIWFTSVTIRLSNRFYKFIGEGFLGDTEVGDAMFVLLFDLAFTVFHPSVHLSFVISISITAYWFLISFLRHWFSFSSILIFPNKISAESFLIALSSANFLLMKFLKSLFAVMFFSSSCLNKSIWCWIYVVSFEVRCSIIGVFGNTGETGERSIGMFVAMGINTSPSLQ